jgi:hypothetical protein
VSLILKLMLIGCIAAPLLAASAFYAAVLLAALIGMRIDPLAMGLSRVDDAMTATVCGLGLRPLR